MRICVLSEILIVLFTSNVSWITDAAMMRNRKEVEANKSSEKSLGGNGQQRRPVTEEEISYIASTLQPRECLSMLYLLHHDYKRRRRRDVTMEKHKNHQERSAQITPCETMLLNYWRDPRSRNKKDCSHVSRTLRQVRRQDLARWLWARRPPCSGRTLSMNGTNDASSMTAQMQVIPIYSSRPTAARRTSTESTTNWDSILWLYIALAVCATTTVLLCVHYLFTRLGKSSKYIGLPGRDMRNMQYSCGCVDKQMSLPCNKKKRYLPPPPPPQMGCGCSGN